MMQKIISLSSILALALLLWACNQDTPATTTDMVEAPAIEKEALAPETNTPGEKEIEINVDELPEAIKKAIQSTYAGAELLEADQITRPDGSIYFDVEIKHQEKVLELMYESDGSFLGIEEEGDDDDDDEGDDDEDEDGE